MDHKSEEGIIKQVLKGNTNGFAVLVDNHKKKVFNLALRILGNREDAEEVAQDAFVKAFHSLSKFRGDGPFAGWLLRITYNSALTFLKRKRGNVVPLETPGIEHQMVNDHPSLSDTLHEAERKRFIHAALDQLKEEEKAAITLFYLYGHPIREIGEIMQMAESNVKIHLFRGRKRMLTELKKIMKEELIYLL